MRAFSNSLMYLFAFGLAGFVVYAYGYLPLGAAVQEPEMRASFLAHPGGIYAHAFASTVALVLGPFQFSSRLRQRYANFHRWLGRAYLSVGVLVGGLAALYISQYAYGGIFAKVGFALLATIWLYTGAQAYLAVRRGALAEHRKWMVRNLALTFAAVTLRIYLPIAMMAGLPFAAAYPVIAWLCWLSNLAYAEWRYNRGGVSVA